jgi:hypothetical protein
MDKAPKEAKPELDKLIQYDQVGASRAETIAKGAQEKKKSVIARVVAKANRGALSRKPRASNATRVETAIATDKTSKKPGKKGESTEPTVFAAHDATMMPPRNCADRKINLPNFLICPGCMLAAAALVESTTPETKTPSAKTPKITAIIKNDSSEIPELVPTNQRIFPPHVRLEGVSNKIQPKSKFPQAVIESGG